MAKQRKFHACPACLSIFEQLQKAKNLHKAVRIYLH